MKKQIFTLIAVVLGLTVNADEAFTVEFVEARIWDTGDAATVEIRGESATKMYLILLKQGFAPTNLGHSGLLLGESLSCHIEGQESVRIGHQWVKRDLHVCSFNMVEGKIEPNVTDGIGPRPGVTISN